MADDISLIVGVDYKEMTGFIKTAGQTKRVVKEIAKEFARTGDQSRYMSSINAVVRADAKLAEASRLGQSEIMKLGAAMRQEAKFADQLTTATKRLNVAQQQTKRGTNQLGVLFQQTGYQVGDFAVQVQSGTNVMVAFGQQATQLVGTFAMLAKSTKMIALFSGLGIIVPIATALAGAFMRAKDSAKEAAASLSSFEEKLKSARGEVQSMKDQLELLNSGFETAAELALSQNVIISEKELKSAEDALDKIVKKNEAVLVIGGMISKRQLNTAKSEVEAAEKRVEAARMELHSSRELSRQQKGRKAAAEHLKKVNALAESDAKRRFEFALKYIAEEAKAKEDAEKAAAEHLKKVNALAESDAKRRFESALKYIQEQAKAKEDAEKKARADQKRYFTEGQAANKVFVDSLNEASDEARKKAEKQINLVAQLEEKYGETLVTALALAGVDISASMADFIDKAVKAQSDLEGLSGTYGTQLDIVNAQIKALEEGKNVEVAAFIEGERAKITALYESSKAFAMKTKDIEALAEASLAFLAAMGELDALAAARTKLAGLKDTSKGSSKKSPAEQLREYLDTLGKQAELESKLVGLFGEKRNTEEEVIKARQKYGEVFGATQEAELRGTLAQIEADKKRQKVLEEAKAQQQQIADTIQSSMEDAFMSIVDGTKSAEDAFKDMARIIIKELYKVLVVQQLVGSFEAGGGGILGSLFGAIQADGGAWQGGSQIKAYANGGIVGGPTVFPMARGKIGLMGEAGPEAIMPLKRGANGKLGVQAEGGGGDNVVVHQNFNFQANGDDSVKRIIAQAAPQIANMTKKSMLDDRRRGGQMKATFG